MPKSHESTQEVRIRDDGDVALINNSTQVFDREDFVEIFNEHVERLQQLNQQIEDNEEEVVEKLEENNIGALHTALEGEPNDSTDVEPNSITAEDLQVYQELQQLKQQREQLNQRSQQFRNMLEASEEAVQQIADGNEDLEVDDIPE